MYSEPSAQAAQSIVRPAGYKLLVALPALEEKTKGGIYLPDKLKDEEKTASVVGKVVAMGPDAYSDPQRCSVPYCEIGDWIVFRSYSGTRIKIEGAEYRLINDDTVEAVIADPAKVQRG